MYESKVLLKSWASWYRPVISASGRTKKEEPESGACQGYIVTPCPKTIITIKPVRLSWQRMRWKQHTGAAPGDTRGPPRQRCVSIRTQVSPVPDTGTGKANTAWLLQSHSCFTWHVRHQQRHVSLLTDTSSLPCKVDLQALCGFLIEQRDFPPKLLSRWILLTERWNIITELGLYQPTTPTWILSKLSPWIFLRQGTLPVASWGVLGCRSQSLSTHYWLY